VFVSYVTGCQIVGETTKMEQDFKLPEYLSLEGNSSENWRRWIQRFELYLVAKEKTKKPDPTKIAMLLSLLAPKHWSETTTSSGANAKTRINSTT